MKEGITIKTKGGAIMARIHYLHPDGRYRSTFRELSTGGRTESDDVIKWLKGLEMEMTLLEST